MKGGAILKKVIIGLVSVLFIVSFIAIAGVDADAAKYIGAKKCKACHMKQFKAWKKTNMATSFENLKPGVKVEEKKKVGQDPDKDYTTDAECLKCHTTGYGQGGFVSMEKTPKLAGVQCESCHGPGGDFKKIMKKNKKFKLSEVKAAGLLVPTETENNCMDCHGGDSPFNEQVDPKYKFEIKERLEKTHKHFPLKYEH
jgi:mono/diheme cytochrome c family protein